MDKSAPITLTGSNSTSKWTIERSSSSVDVEEQGDPFQLYSPLADFSTRSTADPLSAAEISALFDEINTGPGDYLLIEELQTKLVQTYKALVRQQDSEASQREFAESEGLQLFFRALVPRGQVMLTRAEFIKVVQAWNVPRRAHSTDDDNDHVQRTPWHRRLALYWTLRGPKIVFVSLVVLMQISMGLIQCVRYGTDPAALAAFGPGVVIAKTCAGALYPTMALLLLSMSRWATTWVRRVVPGGSVINWDRARSFHIWMACSALVLGCVHGIAHLSGTFAHAAQPQHHAAVVHQLPAVASWGSLTYGSFFALLPLWTGLASVLLFIIIACFAAPPIRRRNYELFQASHLLMIPLLGLLCGHGAASLLQRPQLPWWLLGPMVLVVSERTRRFTRTFFPIPATITVLDRDAVSVTCQNPAGHYAPGQYIFLHVPALSRFQWHPFTISTCTANTMQLHIKTDGNWTRRLRGLPASTRVALDGPYGAPSQRFYEFDHAVVVGTGVGITPYAAILADLAHKLAARVDPWSKTSTPSSSRAASIKSNSPVSPHPAVIAAARKRQSILLPPTELAELALQTPNHTRHVALHWLVRTSTTLSWFASLLNRAHALANPGLALTLTTHITAAPAAAPLTAHVFSYLLDSYRTPTSPVSVISGLASRSMFGRPDWRAVLLRFHARIVAGGSPRERQRVGVFFCGSPGVANVLVRECAALNRRCVERGENVVYEVLVEVFG